MQIGSGGSAISRRGLMMRRVVALSFGLLSASTATAVLAATYGSVDTPAAFAAAADRSQQAIARCDAAAATCVAQELDRYADWIEGVAPQLPPELRVLPTIVRQAASGVRAAKTRREAVRAVQAAITEVRKTINILRADDPDAQQTATREASFSIDTLVVATTKLEKATNL